MTNANPASRRRPARHSIALRLAAAVLMSCGPASTVRARAPSAAAIQAEIPSEVTVTGRRANVVEAYVDKVAKPDPDRQIARWNDPICLGISNVAPPFAHAIRTRFRDMAGRLGLRLSRGACTPNLQITLSNQADALAAAHVKRGARAIGNPDDRVLLDRRLRAAMLAPRTVRWFAATRTVYDDGSPLVHDASGHVVVHAASLVRPGVQESTAFTFVIVDAARLRAATLRQFTDYLLFVALAHPDIRADFTQPNTIMSLFAEGRDGAAPPGLTGFDEALLESLYLGSGAKTVAQQKNDLRRAVAGSGRGRDTADGSGASVP